ncbi:MAG TPA: universal stress protein [Thermoleophilaceae bacterium]|nr:universal stress protein [Thermoleophilaceae bacterium]
MAGRARQGLRRGSEAAEARIIRGLGEPAIFAITLSAVVAATYFTLGVVAKDALGLTPLVYLLTGAFFVLTVMTYVEGSSLHPERGGASTFARYAFDEFWSFIAGWAILLDYRIVMAIGAVAIAEYLGAFWGGAGQGLGELAIAAAALTFVAFMNVRGLHAGRLRTVLRLSLANLVLLVVVAGIALGQSFDLAAITDSVDLGSTPTWEDAAFAAVVASVAMLGIEAASGLAGEVRVGHRGLQRVVLATAAVALVLLVGVSTAGLMALPVEGGQTALAGRYLEAPVLGIASTFDPVWLMDVFRYLVGFLAAALLLATMNGQMLGLARLSYELASNRQVPSGVGRLHNQRGTPYVAICVAAAIAFGLALSRDIEFLVGIFAFGAMLTFAIAHVSVIVLRFRERERRSAYRVPLSLPVGRGSLPLPSLLGARLAIAAWISVVVLHSGARAVGGVWMAIGVLLYVSYRRAQDKPLTKRFTIPAEALQRRAGSAYGSILVPVFGESIDDEIVGTAGRLASEDADATEGGAVLEVLYVFEMPMSLPIDARVPEERVSHAKRVLARAKDVGEEYDGVEVATAMVRGRTAGQAIVSEARRRGVEAIVLAAEEPTRIRGGAVLGGRSRTHDRFVGSTTRYVVEKAPCKVILTAPPAGEEGTREGVRP